MRVLITGAWGNLGMSVVPVLGRYFSLFPFAKTVDIRDFRLLKGAFLEVKPDVVVHLAALTDLKLCENNPALAYEVNVNSTRNIVILCKELGSYLIFTSSPFVFDGTKGLPYLESDRPNPINVYGRTKLESEQIIFESGVKALILRLGWLFGPYCSRFSNKVIKMLLDGVRLELSADSFLTPLYTIDCAEFIVNAILQKRTGLAHIGNSGGCSPYEFGLFVAEMLGTEKPLPTTFDRLKFEINRPRNFSISSESGLELRNWKEALSCFLREIKEKPYWLCF